MKFTPKYLLLMLSLWVGLMACQGLKSSGIGNRPTNALFPAYTALPAQDRAWIDSLLVYGLDHEALYTLLDSLKPISSLRSFTAPIARDSGTVEGSAEALRNAIYLDTLQQVQALIQAIEHPRWDFCWMPFQTNYKGQRHCQLLVVHRGRFRALMQEHATFFGQWGFTPDTSPAVVLAFVECAPNLDRFRGYGYLFGYPKHAVDFFVEAARTSQQKGEFVKRSFFHIPTYAAPSGYFTYALPEGAIPSAQDSALYRRAEKVLIHYRALRAQYQEPSGVRVMDLLQAAGL